MGSMARTNAQIAERIGLTHSGVSRIRSGGRVPTFETMRAIENAFGWSLEEQSRAASNDAYAQSFDAKVVQTSDETTAAVSG